HLSVHRAQSRGGRTDRDPRGRDVRRAHRRDGAPPDAVRLPARPPHAGPAARDPPSSRARYRTPPIIRLIVGVSAMSTSAMTVVMANSPPNNVAGDRRSLNPPANPASMFPTPIEKKNTPIIAPE